MAITYGFFNSVNGDRLYNADDISNYFLKLISNGVFATPANAMQVQENDGMIVQVSAGWGFINCKWINNSAPYLLTLDASDVVLNRIDRIVMRLNASNDVRTMEIAIKKGALASNPQPPALQRVEGDVWELSLAQIAINAGVTAITQADITDERPDINLCGWVTGLIDQIDTTNLFAQYNSAFNTWFESIKDEVKSTTIVIQYHSKYETTQASEATIPININEYNETLDILYVYINGLKLIPGVDYTIDGSNIILSQALDVIGTIVEFEVLKSVDTAQAESIVTTIFQLFTKVEGLENRVVNLESTTAGIEESLSGLSFVKINKTDFDALTTKDPNKVYFVYDDANKITMFLGETKLSSGTAAARVAVKAVPLLASLRGVSYTPAYPANICEVAYADYPNNPSPVSIKPRGECLAILAINTTSAALSENFNTIVQEGWEPLITVPFSTSTVVPDNRALAVFTRHSDGGEVYGTNYASGGASGIMLLYGAKSVNVVQSGNLPLSTTYSYQYDTDVERTLYGYTTDAPTTNKRVYMVSKRVYSSVNANICTDHADLATATGVPDEYNFTVSNGGMGEPLSMNFDDVNDNGGLTWFTEYKDNAPSSYVPSIPNTYYATLVLDVIYD